MSQFKQYRSTLWNLLYKTGMWRCPVVYHVDRTWSVAARRVDVRLSRVSCCSIRASVIGSVVREAKSRKDAYWEGDMLMLSLHRLQGQDKNVLTCPRQRCELNWRVFSSQYSWVVNWKLGRDKTKPSSHCISRQDKALLTCLQFSSHHRHGQDETRQSALQMKCEAKITHVVRLYRLACQL